MAKEGSTISGLMDSFATAISLALQYGVPLRTLVSKFSYVRFEPSGMTGNSEIPIAKSLIDYIFRWLGLKFLDAPERDAIGAENRPALSNGHAGAGAPAAAPREGVLAAIQQQQDAPPCSECGAIMVRNGSCYKCANCGSTSGCS